MLEVFRFENAAINHTFNIALTAFVIVVVGLVLIRIILKLCDNLFSGAKKLNALKTYAISAIKVVLYILLLLVLLGTLGVEITSFVAILSVVGVALSLALQNTLSNVASGILLLVSKPFTVGDYVSCDGVEGTVKAVDLAYTTFVTVDNKEIFFPNSQVVSTKLVNFNALGTRRVTLELTASYDAPTEKVKIALAQAMDRFPQILETPGREIYLTGYGSSCITYSVRAWVKAEDYWTVHFGLLEAVRETFADNEVEMTYDHLNVHLVEKS